MSWTRAVIFLGTLVFVGGTTSPRDQSGKFLFNIVRFANDACEAADGKTGVCMTSSECTKAGGGASGTCAKGYGTCCLLVKMKCDDTVTANNTYIRNPEYSASWKPTSKEQCKFTLENPGDVCQYRLDFDDLSLESPTVGAAGAIRLGDCATDSMTVTDVNKAVLPTICGKNSGQHMYVEAGEKSDKAVIDFTITNAATWDIRVTQIKCGSSLLAPTGALQYHLDGMGTAETFNFGGSKQLLQGHDYTICVKPQAGSCGIEWSEDSDTTDAFLMNTGLTFQAGIPTIADFGLAGQALKPGPVVGDACDESWITIPGACTTTSKKEVEDTGDGSAAIAATALNAQFKYLGMQDRMCGYHLNNRGMTGANYGTIAADLDGGIQAVAAAAPANPDFGSSNIMETVTSTSSYCMYVHSALNADLADTNMSPTGFKLMYKLKNC